MSPANQFMIISHSAASAIGAQTASSAGFSRPVRADMVVVAPLGTQISDLFLHKCWALLAMAALAFGLLPASGAQQISPPPLSVSIGTSNRIEIFWPGNATSF